MISRSHHILRCRGRALSSACTSNERCIPSKNAMQQNITRPISSVAPSQKIMLHHTRDNQIELYRRCRKTNIISIAGSHQLVLFSTFTKSEYIHPLSQIVLEHLQSSHSQWVQHVGLDTGLKLNKDGTFVLRFPGTDDGESLAGSICDDKTDESCTGNSNKLPVNGSIW